MADLTLTIDGSLLRTSRDCGGGKILTDSISSCFTTTKVEDELDSGDWSKLELKDNTGKAIVLSYQEVDKVTYPDFESWYVAVSGMSSCLL